jgi:hypothetical protein
MSAYALWAAIRTVKSRVGTWVGYTQATEAGLDVDRSEWATWIGQARAALAQRDLEMTRPLNRRPIAGEIVEYSTQRASGFLQHVDIFVQDRDTGLIEARPYTIRTDTLRSRQSIVNEAVERYQRAIDENPDNYPEDIVDANYAGTFNMVPR